MLSAEEANRRYFREAYRTGDHGWPVEEPTAEVVGFLERVSRIVPGGELLDVGCGEGRHSFAAAGLGFKVTGVDYEPLALRRARRLARDRQVHGVTFRKADVFRLPFPASRFDVVVDCGCLHHQRKRDWPRYKASILRVLRPRGFFVLTVFSPGFRFFRGSPRPWRFAEDGYRRCFTPGDIRALFGGDFEVLEMIRDHGEERGFWHVLMRRLAGGEVARTDT